VNHQPLPEYFNRVFWRELCIQPFEVSHTLGRFDVWCTVKGGGLSGAQCRVQCSPVGAHRRGGQDKRAPSATA
jgi:small subunit ribosomal protein S9